MRYVSLLLFALLAAPLSAQTTFYLEGFEGSAFDRYDLRTNSCTPHFTFNSFLHDGEDYVHRGGAPPAPASFETLVGGYAGNFIMAEDIDGAYGGGAGNICFQLHPVDISGKTDLQLSWRVSTSGNTGNDNPGDGRYEAFDAVYLEYAVDDGTFVRVGRIEGGDNSSQATNYTTHDDDGDGVCNALTETHVTSEAQVFTYDLPGVLGSSIVIRVYIIGMAGAHEEVQFDDLAIMGRDLLPVEVETLVASIKGAYSLSSAYPNPFSSQATFTLAIAQPQHVRVAVYDLLGRQVALLHEGMLSAHQAYPFTWHAHHLRSGPYVYHATGERFGTASRLVILSR